MPYGINIWNGMVCGTLNITHLPLVHGWYLADSECGWTFRKFKIHDPKIELLHKTSCTRRCWDLTYNIIFTIRTYFGCQRKSYISKTNKGKILTITSEKVSNLKCAFIFSQNFFSRSEMYFTVYDYT